MAQAQDKMYQAALEAIDQGQTARARDLFTRLLRSDSSNAEYWLWMSTLVDTAQERIYCLESALRVDPNNEAAKRGLIVLGAREADKDVVPVPPIRRNWEKDLEKVSEPSKPAKPVNLNISRLWENRNTRIAGLVFLALVFIGAIYGTIHGLSKKPEPVVYYKVSPFPSSTPVPTASPTVTEVSLIPSATPVMQASTPLWAFLTETYTPVPLYVNTPHPMVEAYRAAIRSLDRSDWSSVLAFMQQATTAEPDSPDLLYYEAEAYRMMGNYQEAVIAYGQALHSNPTFAPAYLGRALAYEKINPKADIEGELNYAISYDPYYVEAYLTRARIRIENKNPNGALDDLLIAEGLFPNNPMVYVLRAQADVELNNISAALENAQKGYDLDRTSLAAYYTLALVYLSSGDNNQAIHYVDIYLVYSLDDARGYAVRSQAEYQLGNYDLALAACEQGIKVDNENAPSWYYCGLIYLYMNDTRTAVNDFVSAVNLDLSNFEYSVALGKALWADQRLAMAVRQFNSAETLATTDYQLAVVYYNRGQILEEASSTTEALQDWERLLALPPDQVPQEWRKYAQERWNFYFPPTPTEIPTETPIPTITQTPGPSPTPTDRL